ncbi:MAG: hypothetical protein QOF76_543 [Solirubrobacteraceae bacterium]|jgi:D-serine deaminase-like pyridoxal phosphate-dependent protein|nr:hypothetical protein [Solirubrobacteraceae bacterium]
MRTDALDTPVLLADLDVFDANLARCVADLDGRAALRPHLKTTKSPDAARRLLAGGATGVCVAKLSEAEVMLAAGLSDVLITTEIAGYAKVGRLAALLKAHPDQRVIVVVDDDSAARVIHSILANARLPPVDVLLDIDVGQHRTGVAPADAPHLARVVSRLDRLRIVGVQGYEGHLQHVRDPAERDALVDAAMERLTDTADTLKDGGHAIDIVSTGGTGTATRCASHAAVTEVQPGSFVFMDGDYLATGGLPYAAGLTVRATVISRHGDRVVVDAGLKTLSDDSGPATVLTPQGLSYHHAGDEHGLLSGPNDLAVGDVVTLIPSHCDTTVNLHDELVVQRDGEIVDRWPISARGRVQ